MKYIARFNIEQVLSYVEPITTKENKTKRKQKVDFIGYKVNLDVQTLRVLKLKGTKCNICGLEGCIMILQQHVDESPHFQLYGLEQNWYVPFTKDHIVPRSKKGINHINNLQVACLPCNLAKGNQSTNQPARYFFLNSVGVSVIINEIVPLVTLREQYE